MYIIIVFSLANVKAGTWWHCAM